MRDAHVFGVSDVGWNPNRRFEVASVGEDGCLCVWDVRRTEMPMIAVVAHEVPHAACRVAYNPFHDRLILTSGTDGVVRLWDLERARPEPDRAGKGGGGGVGDVLSPGRGGRGGGLREPMCAFPHHDDSVYGLAWSGADEFAFASVSYDGRLVVNALPKSVKDEVLLS